MAKISIKPRTGKDFFEFNQRVLINANLAQDWAIEKFVLVNGEPITQDQIAKLSSENYLRLTSSIFNINNTPASDEIDYIEIMGYTIPKKKISRDFISELQQTINKNSNGDNIKIIKFCISKFFDISIKELEEMPYQVAGYLLNKINFFLISITEPTDEFDADELSDPVSG